MMSNLMCRKPVNRNLLDPADGTCESYVGGPRIPAAQEPIPVRVRVRQYGDFVPATQPARSDKPDLGQLPVGSILDCYI